jgi:hypothetical protein
MMVAEHMVQQGNENPEHNLEFTTGTGLVIDALRVLVVTGKFPPDQILFMYKDQMMMVDENGRLDAWPDGFHDYTEKYLMQLL